MLISLVLVESDTYAVNEAFRKGIFETVSIATTTGFTTSDFVTWPTFIPFLLLMSAFIGACAGSTGGGIKIIRLLLLYKQGSREIKRLIHPNAVIPIKIGKKPVSSRVIEAVWGFSSSVCADICRIDADLHGVREVIRSLHIPQSEPA